jgi:two-component system, cell cycle sensor histidine kinase and response regulator CckA
MKTKTVASKFRIIILCSISISVVVYSIIIMMIRANTSLPSNIFWLCVFEFLLAGLSTLILYGLFQYLFKKNVLFPLKKLTLSMQMNNYPYQTDVNLDTHDEFMLLAETYSCLRKKLEDTSSELFKLNEDLEKRVLERTKEIEAANDLLQKDISARESMEKALRESEDRYRKTFEAAPDSIVIIRMHDGKYLDVNEAFCRLTDFSKKEVIGKTISDIDVIGDSTDREIVKSTLRNDQKVSSLEIKCRKKDGAFLSVLVSARIIMYGDDECLITILTDITERKKIEAALRESEEKYRLLTENANDAIFIIQDGKILFPNPKASELGRYLGGRPESSSYFDYIHPGDRAMIIERHLKRISGETLPDICTFRLVTDAGEELWVEMNDVSIFWGGRPAILSFLRDITNQKKLESKMEQTERMDAIGTLAGGIAHNFNNLLMGIQGNLSLIFLDEESSKKNFDELKSIERCVENGANLTKQLLGFARGGKYIVKPINTNEIVQNTSKMFGQSKKEIKIHGSYQKSIWTIEADQGQIELVLLNIYVNAAQAMETGGDIYLSTENVTFSESDATFLGLLTRKFVKISIVDTGPGIDEKIMGKIFEPFFTTKEIGEGTGLGLASAFGIVKNHGGFIDVKSKKGEGARFDIYFPATDEQNLSEEILIEDLATGTETILLIDDEDIVVDVCQSMLKKLGYKVIAARGGKIGIDIYKQKKEKISLVILDIIMPDMEGGQVFNRIKEINPTAKVLLSSGCSINNQVSTILEKGGNGFIQKPFKIKQLSSSIRDIIGR